MHTHSHGLVSWVVANGANVERRERILITLAGLAPDLDGLSILGGREAFQAYHHVWGHNVLFAVLFAAVAALQETYFSTYFHTTVGISFTEWIRKRRIAKAIQLFASEDLPVATVSRHTGFTSNRTFQRVFKQIVGISPFEYKREVRKRLLTSSSTIF